MSLPSRDLIDSSAPSTASRVPRMRTVCGCCAEADVPSRVTKASEAASIRGDNEDFSMDFSQGELAPNATQTPRGRRYSTRNFLPSPLVAEGGAKRRMGGSIHELNLRKHTPHPPPLRSDTFPTRGEGK